MGRRPTDARPSRLAPFGPIAARPRKRNLRKGRRSGDRPPALCPAIPQYHGCPLTWLRDDGHRNIRDAAGANWPGIDSSVRIDRSRHDRGFIWQRSGTSRKGQCTKTWGKRREPRSLRRIFLRKPRKARWGQKGQTSREWLSVISNLWESHS